MKGSNKMMCMVGTFVLVMSFSLKRKNIVHPDGNKENTLIVSWSPLSALATLWVLSLFKEE